MPPRRRPRSTGRARRTRSCLRSARSSAGTACSTRSAASRSCCSYGPVAAWRAFAPGMSPGTRRRRAERATCGHSATAPRSRRRVHGGDRRRRSTRFQAAHGAARDGRRCCSARSCSSPAPVRVTGVTPTVGATVQPGPVLDDHLDGPAGDDRSSTQAQQSEVEGRRPGHDHTARQQHDARAASRTSGRSRRPRRAPTRAARAAASSTPTIEVDVTPTAPGRDRPPRPGAGQRLDHDRQRAATRSSCRSTRCSRSPPAATRSRRSPPAALTTSSASRLGLFDDADGLVQVSGNRLAAGQRVVVPTPMSAALLRSLELRRHVDQDLRQRSLPVTRARRRQLHRPTPASCSRSSGRPARGSRRCCT